MKSRKALLAISAILLMTSLSVSSSLAITVPQATLSPADLSIRSTDVTGPDHVVISFLNDLTKVKSLDGLHRLVDSYLSKFRNHPLFRWLHHTICKITFERHILALRQVRTTAFVISMGTMNRFFTKPNINMAFYRPYTIWFYGNQGTPISKSRTFVIDFFPFSIRNVAGRQVGFMHNFYGFYVSSYRPLLGGQHTFFFGHVQRIRTVDLSPFT